MLTAKHFGPWGGDCVNAHVPLAFQSPICLVDAILGLEFMCCHYHPTFESWILLINLQLLEDIRSQSSVDVNLQEVRFPRLSE